MCLPITPVPIILTTYNAEDTMNPVQYRNVTGYISSGDASGDVTGDTIDAAQFRKVCMVAVNTSTGTPVAEIYIQHSNDDSTWVNGATASISGGETNLLEDDLYARYTRFFYDHTSDGTGATISVTYTLKS
jgi:hypothetical protein